MLVPKIPNFMFSFFPSFTCIFLNFEISIFQDALFKSVLFDGCKKILSWVLSLRLELIEIANILLGTTKIGDLFWKPNY